MYNYTYFYLKESGSDKEEATIVKRGHRKTKANPNVQGTSKKQKKQHSSSSSETEESLVSVNYKSNRSVMPLGPGDQGATAELVN